ncbi:hypothetical protein GEMRC1_010365 [Eukaryota sp. GEM-RC1]
MDCCCCCQSFNSSDRIPLLICRGGHTVCSRCSGSLNNCPVCRIDCFRDRVVNDALHDLVKASRDGHLCPRILSDHIILEDMIAEGGFAIIYAAKWSLLPVAVKLVSLTEKGRLKLQREMNMISNLSHPSIIRVFGISFFHDTVGIVMEKASSSLPTPNSLSPLTLRYAKELCEGVKFLHQKSVVHGDLKPSKILLVDGHVRLSGFSNAKHLVNDDVDDDDVSFAVTPKYTSPDQFERSLSTASDIYSLGIVLYELLTGKEAFKDCTMLEIIKAKMRGTPLLFDKSTPPSLRELITKCVNLNNELRPKITGNN